MSKGRETNLMKESYDFSVSIRTLKKELPETSQIGIGDDAYRVQGFIIINYHAASDIE